MIPLCASMTSCCVDGMGSDSACMSCSYRVAASSAAAALNAFALFWLQKYCRADLNRCPRRCRGRYCPQPCVCPKACKGRNCPKPCRGRHCPEPCPKRYCPQPPQARTYACLAAH